MEPKKANEEPSQQKFLTWVTIVFSITLLLIAFLSYYLVFLYPENQVSQLGITNVTEKANFINQYRITSIQLISTFAQILGGGAVLVGIYFAWKNFGLAQATLKSDQETSQKNLEVALATLKSDQEKSQKDLEVAQATLESNMKNAQDNLKVVQEGQITERFTRAIDQLGNEKMEIRLGGIYALERISNESEKDYWPIMEILTAYIRKNSKVDSKLNENSLAIEPISKNTQANESTKNEVSDDGKIFLDIQAILTVIARRKNYFNNGESIPLNLKSTCLQNADLNGAHLEKTDFNDAHLEGANLFGAHLEGANLFGAHLEGAKLNKANLRNAYLKKANCKKATFSGYANLEIAKLEEANLEEAYLRKAKLESAILKNANLKRANFEAANLEEANLEGSDLKEAKLGGARFKGANLKGSDLKKANLGGAILEGANLEGANLEGAYLGIYIIEHVIKLGEGANLLNADLKDANLKGVDFEKANLEGANLEGANLTNTLNLSINQLSRAKTLYNAKLDPDLEVPLREKYPALFEKSDE